MALSKPLKPQLLTEKDNGKPPPVISFPRLVTASQKWQVVERPDLGWSTDYQFIIPLLNTIQGIIQILLAFVRMNLLNRVHFEKLCHITLQ